MVPGHSLLKTHFFSCKRTKPGCEHTDTSLWGRVRGEPAWHQQQIMAKLLLRNNFTVTHPFLAEISTLCLVIWPVTRLQPIGCNFTATLIACVHSCSMMAEPFAGDFQHVDSYSRASISLDARALNIKAWVQKVALLCLHLWPCCTKVFPPPPVEISPTTQKWVKKRWLIVFLIWMCSSSTAASAINLSHVFLY